MKLTCRCVREPNGDAGLEGYNEGDTYRCERVCCGPKAPYWRVWPDPEFAPTYYETCGVGTFKRYFKLIAE